MEIVDPFLNEKTTCMEYDCKGYYDGCNPLLGIRLWENDFQMVEECEGLLAYIPSKEMVMGTIAEIEYARNLGKKIFIISEINHPYLDWLETSEKVEIVSWDELSTPSSCEEDKGENR